MEFHLPGPIRSLRDLLTHLGIITLGILIALALEQLVEAHHRTKLAAEAVAGFRRELADNRADVQATMAAMPQLRAVATQALNEIPYDKAKRYVEAYGVLRVFFDEERAGLAAWKDMRIFGNDSAQLTPDQRRELIEQLRHYESFTYVIDMVGKGALQACDRVLQ
jgi:hypothetical protein